MMISGWKWLLLDWHGSECVCLSWSVQIHGNPSIGSGGGGVRYQPCVVFIWTGWILKLRTGLNFRFFLHPFRQLCQAPNIKSFFTALANETCFLIGTFYLPFPQNHCSTNMIRNNFSPRVLNVDVPGTKEPTKIGDDEFTSRQCGQDPTYTCWYFSFAFSNPKHWTTWTACINCSMFCQTIEIEWHRCKYIHQFSDNGLYLNRFNKTQSNYFFKHMINWQIFSEVSTFHSHNIFLLGFSIMKIWQRQMWPRPFLRNAPCCSLTGWWGPRLADWPVCKSGSTLVALIEWKH